MKRSQFLQWVSLSLGGTLLLAACGAPAPSSSEASKILKVATEPAFAPFEFKQGDQLTGFSIDLMNAIAKAEGLQIQFESLPFDGIIPALQSGTVDAAISSITITPERSKTVTFSRPYFKAGLAIAVRSDETEIKRLEDLAGRRIAVQIGTTGAKKAQEVTNAKISTFDSAPLALQELANGNADAVINDAPVTLYAIQTGQLNNIRVIGSLLTDEFYGIALPKQSQYLETLNRGLGTVIQAGTYAEIYQKWFGEQPPSLPERYDPAQSLPQRSE
ncbi:basic amino acid ABC transporter substrate-binding protein [Lyngbya confervoides]|uniref:Basic amino acid ABC transporter substrate-binding protein n=1 Tax=Lyngbya confervoides BDU141951 TaxID=1574623 RepID=A0ABD4T7D9_9CYAN|nr:basic amino acid ABC transporter substrate-binding protein [Lyngbya confervoides]MCM1984648.1 basic amino acid ABC transporter substrate-binding protein [Lyngbya confervoides BDU141951]